MIFNDDVNDMIANVFAFGVFADKNSGIVHHNLTGLFPFVSLDGSICFFVLYHYESNSILAEPITGLVTGQYSWHARCSLTSSQQGASR
jgi:hypothetical protein